MRRELIVCNAFVSTQAFLETMPLLAKGGVAFSVMTAFALRAVIMQSLLAAAETFQFFSTASDRMTFGDWRRLIGAT